MKKIFHFRVLTLLFLAFLTACTSSIPFTLDNPTDGPLQVNLDGKAITLAPRSGLEVKLAPGRHTLDSPLTGPRAFLVYVRSRGGIINPTLSPYITYNLVYATSAETAKHFSPFEKEITLDGVTFRGPFTCSRELFIDKNWAFGVHEAVPDKIRVGRDREGNIQGKVYTREAFVAEIEAMSGEAGRFQRERRAEPAAAFQPGGPRVPPPSGPADWDNALAPLRDICARYLKAEQASEQEALQKAFHEAMLGLVQYTSRTAYHLDGPENVRRSAEQEALSDCFSHAAVLLPK